MNKRAQELDDVQRCLVSLEDSAKAYSNSERSNNAEIIRLRTELDKSKETIASNQKVHYKNLMLLSYLVSGNCPS